MVVVLSMTDVVFSFGGFVRGLKELKILVCVRKGERGGRLWLIDLWLIE
jgi:hypothetical protein